LPAGYASVRTESLVPSELEAIKTGDAFMESLPGYDEQFDRLRAEAAEDGQVLRFVGVVDASKGEIKAELARCVFGESRLMAKADQSVDILPRTRSPPPLVDRIISSCSTQNVTALAR
jgi:hypothetical protein